MSPPTGVDAPSSTVSPSSSAEADGGPIRARVAGPDDLAALVDSHLATAEFLSPLRGGARIVGDMGRGETREHVAATLRADLADPGCDVMVGCIAEAVVGHAVLRYPDRTGVAELTELFVAPGAREVGVGSALLSAARTAAISQGCTGLDSLALPGDRATKNFFEDHAMVARAIVVHGALEP